MIELITNPTDIIIMTRFIVFFHTDSRLLIGMLS